eukprot:6211985-Pleurochrysis_carterae.AAC.6
MPARRLSRDDNVVNLEYEADALGGEADGGGVDEERHEHVLFEDVGDAPLAHVDARRRLARRVPVAQIRHHLPMRREADERARVRGRGVRVCVSEREEGGRGGAIDGWTALRDEESRASEG